MAYLSWHVTEISVTNQILSYERLPVERTQCIKLGIRKQFIV